MFLCPAKLRKLAVRKVLLEAHLLIGGGCLDTLHTLCSPANFSLSGLLEVGNDRSMWNMRLIGILSGKIVPVLTCLPLQPFENSTNVALPRLPTTTRRHRILLLARAL